VSAPQVADAYPQVVASHPQVAAVALPAVMDVRLFKPDRKSFRKDVK
jgi:hypothetical protein